VKKPTKRRPNEQHHSYRRRAQPHTRRGAATPPTTPPGPFTCAISFRQPQSVRMTTPGPSPPAATDARQTHQESHRATLAARFAHTPTASPRHLRPSRAQQGHGGAAGAPANRDGSRLLGRLWNLPRGVQRGVAGPTTTSRTAAVCGRGVCYRGPRLPPRPRRVRGPCATDQAWGEIIYRGARVIYLWAA
jgi:hypothetical protein